SYVMLAPALVLFGVFVLYPLVGAVRISLTNSSGIGRATFVGLGNYRDLLSDDVFWKAALNTVLLAVVSVPVSVGIGLGLALLLARTGLVVVLYLSALQGVDADVLEAAELDGTSPWQRLRYVLWPLMRPTTFFVTVLMVIETFQVFDIVWVMTGGGPAGGTE